jgi:hypothetical protein
MLQVDVIVTVEVIVIVTVAVTVEMIMVVTIGLHLYFMEEGQGKERGLYPPSGWSQRIEELDIPSGWILRTR